MAEAQRRQREAEGGRALAESEKKAAAEEAALQAAAATAAAQTGAPAVVAEVAALREQLHAAQQSKADVEEASRRREAELEARVWASNGVGHTRTGAARRSPPSAAVAALPSSASAAAAAAKAAVAPLFAVQPYGGADAQLQELRREARAAQEELAAQRAAAERERQKRQEATRWFRVVAEQQNSAAVGSFRDSFAPSSGYRPYR